MNRKFLSVAIFAALGSMAVGCQKESITEIMSEVSVLETDFTYTMQYKVDGMLYEATIQSEVERTVLLQRLFEMAKDGHEVVLESSSMGTQHFATKEVIRYTTTDKKDAIAWTDKMNKNGYKVIINFNPERKVYECVAWTSND